MIFFIALIPATMLSIAGLVALFVSQRSEGLLRNVGRYLGFWAFTLAVLVVLASVIAAARLHRMHGVGLRYHPMAGPSAPGPRGPPPGAPANPESPAQDRGAAPPAPQR
jgi:hypothetical protein